MTPRTEWLLADGTLAHIGDTIWTIDGTPERIVKPWGKHGYWFTTANMRDFFPDQCYGTELAAAKAKLNFTTRAIDKTRKELSRLADEKLALRAKVKDLAKAASLTPAGRAAVAQQAKEV